MELRRNLLDADTARQQSAQRTEAERAAALADFEQGNRLRETNQLERARQHYLRALALNPAHAPSCANLGALFKDQGDARQAAEYLALAVELDPELVPALYNLAMLYIDQARWAQAAELLERLLVFTPNDADAWYWLGNACTGMGETAKARSAYQTAVHKNAAHVRARWGYVFAQLPVVAQSEDEHAKGVAAFERELDILASRLMSRYRTVGHQSVGALQPYFLAYREADHRAVLSVYGDLCARLMAVWAQKAGLAGVAKAHPGKCRVGMVSAHIHSHSVWHALLKGWVEHLGASDFEIQLFHTGSERDAQTQWAAQHVHRLHQGLGAWTQWVKAVSEAQLDVLIYPEIGMDSTTVRLAALRLARVQLAAWGHPLTTGLPTMDGYISAEAFEPPDAPQHYRESLLTLPRLGCCYHPFGTRADRVDYSVWGIQPADRVLLCAGTPFKYAPLHDAVLVEIARRCQPCKLVFFDSLTPSLSRLLQQRLRAVFQQAQVDFDATVRCVPWQPQAGFFAWLDRTDVYLDTPGFSGFNTVMQAVERATPIVAFEGQFMRGRFASAILRQIGLDSWIANTPEGFAELVVRLAGDASARQAYKRQLRQRRDRLFGDQATVDALAAHLLRLSR